MKKLHEKSPIGLNFGGYVHRNMTGTASGFSHSGNAAPAPLTRNAAYAQQILRLPRNRANNDLQLDVLALPNAGVPHQPTVPRQRPQTQLPQLRRQGTAHSDTHAVEALRHSARSSFSRDHQRAKTVDDRLLAAKIRESSGRKLEPLPKRPPSSSLTTRDLPLSPSKRPPFGTLPPIKGEAAQLKEESESAERLEEDYVNSSESSSDSEDELLDDDESEAPPSRPGFESDLEKSGNSLNIPFPTVNTSVPFQATIIQDHAELDSTRFMAGASAAGISARVDNIVRAFRIHGPLDKQLLTQALNEVASLHPLLSAVFQRYKDKLYVQVRSKGDFKAKVNLESPVVGHEKPEDLVLMARRKLFTLPMSNNLVATSPDSDCSDKVANALSLVSVAGSEIIVGERSPLLQHGDLRKKVSFAQLLPSHQQEQLANSTQATATSEAPQLPSLTHLSPDNDKDAPLLMRARLVSKAVHEHILVLSFPRIICDFWSSCLFSKQLADAYIQLEKSASYRPSLAAMRLENKRQHVINAHEKARTTSLGTGGGRGGKRDGAARLLQKRTQLSNQNKKLPLHPARLQFQQVATRESQLLLMHSREKLYEFWQSMVTATIRRQRGPNRIKLVPPVRIPKGLGDRSYVMTSLTSRGARPQTSRLRPLTASRNRPVTASRRGGGGGGVFGDVGVSREVLMGPQAKFHFMKIEEDVCTVFHQSFPEEHLGQVKQEELLGLFALGTYVLLLGKCCRGWGTEDKSAGSGGTGRGGGEEGGGGVETNRILSQLHNESFTSPVMADPLPRPPRRRVHAPDPIQKYKSAAESRRQQTIVVPYGSLPRGARKANIGGKLDLGSFLIGVDVSLREEDPNMTQGLFAPLSNDVGIRVNLSSSETFIDLVLALGRTLQLARKHGHFPFGTVAEEVGLIHGLPIRFSFFHHHDVIQLTNQDHFYFAEAAMGVEGGHGLARFGTNCYLTPINSKMNDSCHVELLLWEGYDAENMAGGLRYQPHVIRTELVESFASELLRLMAVIAEDPCVLLTDIASQIYPPFLSSRKSKSTRRP